MKDLSYGDVKAQSMAVFGQFGKSKWIPFAKENSVHKNRRDTRELRGRGVGRTLLSVAMGASLEGQIETIKKYRNNFDIVTCDKGFQALLSKGIKPDYVMVCDCNVVWQKWGPKEEDTEGVAMIATPYANLDWTRKWRGPIYFYVNRDAIDSQDTFLEIMGPGTRTIPASSNVSNAQVVFFTGQDEWSQESFAAYERIVLVGYDYSWKPDGNYYAWANPLPKRHYMNHKILRDNSGELVFSSDNLIFSARWLSHYLRAYPMEIVNCSSGILECRRDSLEKVLSVNLKDGFRVRQAAELAASAEQAARKAREILARAKEEYLYGSR